ncbi:transcriptional regulator [Prauserella marina]|uniref:DNA-binding transcriptional regulator of glucitol operon n=1 Tax=Prauserella marina TaxID=530584 RepID=A0A222VM65_9PSEU|nr:transcriptional regulator GutM [Prauserella marina]ASR34853.1 transcriptional regulator [Prauserella marina]PWV85450.1 DNA-binding transcriptional regulator of glucitol operon [Prauserella marina]SDC54531.1 DNA-binding transcriptional regulator of glucitol operon [Prauserella marina]
MSWQAIVTLLGVFVVAGILSYRQHLGYQRAVNELATDENRSGVLLVSGRSKGRLRGAIVLLVIDRRRGEVIRASAMEGSSVFASFKEREDLTGPVEGAEERAGSKALAKAVGDAMRMASRLNAGTLRSAKAGERQQA